MSSSQRATQRREEQKRARQAHLSSPRRRQRKRTPRRALWFWLGFGILVVGVMVWAMVHNRQQAAPIPGIVTYGNLSRDHITGNISYPQTPPVGGAHSPVWQNCGIYTAPVINEHAVHSLEHGAVWITYQPSLNASAIASLRDQVRGQSYVLLSPYPGLPAPIVLSAWGIQLKVTKANDPRIAQFLSTYSQGPQTPEPGAPCSGGVGTPDA